MCDRAVLVTGIHEEFSKTDLQIYFQSKKKSNGGDIESIDYRPDTGEAKITFENDQAARRVIKKNHNLKGCRLTVEMSRDRKTDMSDDSKWALSVLVRGISEKTTKDALQNYFENTRRSSGGDVKDVELNGDQARVTFETPEIATRVLEWGKHALDGQSLTVTRLKPDTPKKVTPKSAQEPANEERSRVVAVKCISSQTTKDALLNFFENKRRSGGGEVEDIQYNQDEGFADITFCSPEDAERVAEKVTLQLDGVPLILKLKEIPKVLPKDLRRVHVIGLSDKTSRDGLMSLMEVAGDEEVESILFGEDSNAMVTFKHPPDFERIAQKCKNRALDGSHLKVEQVSICDCIEVSGLGSKTTSDTILYYFENTKKSGGGDVKKVDYNGGESKALVFFEDSQDVENVVTREHVINGETLKVAPYYPFLGETSQEPGGGKKEKTIPVDPDTIPFIKTFFHQEFQDILKEHEVRQIYEEGQEAIILISTNSKIDKARWDGSCLAIEEYISQIVTQEVQVSPVAWDDLIKQAKEKLQSVKDVMEITCKDKEKRILLHGKKRDVDATAEMLDDLSKEIEKKIEYEKAKVTYTISMSKPQWDLLNITGIAKNLTVQYRDLDVVMREDSTIVFRGPDQVVREGNIDIYKTLSKIKDQEMELSEPITSILTSDPGKVYLAQEFKKKQIEAVICPADGYDTRIIITAVDRQDVKKAVDLIKTALKEDSVPLDEDQKALLLSDNWKEVEGTFSKCTLLKVTRDPSSSVLSIAGIKEQVDEVKETLLAFFEENAIVEKTVEADAAQVKYLFRFEKSKLTKIEEACNQQSVHISVGDDGDELTIRGTKEGTQKAFNDVQKLINQIKEKRVELENPAMKKLFSDKKGMRLLSNIENDHSCIIERCSTGDKRPTRTSSAAVSSNIQQICSYVTPEGKTIALLKGDLTEYKVDVMVNAANSRLQHVGGLARAIALKGGREIQAESDEYILRHDRLLDGEVAVTGPGKLPCKKLVHAVGPSWNKFSKKYKDEETKEERILAQTVFNALEKAKDFTSIAIPAISAGVFGFPADVCAKTIVESILGFSEENDKCKLSEIYIIDINEDVLKAFTQKMRSKFGKMASFTDSKPKTPAKAEPLRASSGNVVGRRRSAAKDERASYKVTPATPTTGNVADIKGIRTEVIIGDLAKEEAHVIVNTVSSDLDLSKNPCAKALSNAAGPALQQECSGKGKLTPGQIAVTQGYSLGCKNVFHVVAGAAWQNGQGEKVLRTLITSCLKEANRLGFSSIAFPAIGTGNLGFPRDVVARIFFQEIESFKKSSPQASILEVHLVLFHKDQPTIDAFQNELRNWRNPDEDEFPRDLEKPKKGKRRSHVSTDEESELSGASSWFSNDDPKNAQIGSVNVDLVTGDITDETTDAIVTVSNSSLDLSLGGGVGAAIAKAGGASIQKECKKLGSQSPGSVVCTSAGKLPSRKLFHLVPASYKPSDMTSIVSKCFQMAESQGINSISVPAVGTGNVNIPPKEAAKALLKAVGKFCKSNPSSVKLIRIVVFQEHMVNDFHRAIEDLITTESNSYWGGVWSWLKGVFSFGTGGTRTTKVQHSSNFYERISEETDMPFSPHQKVWLKILTSDDTRMRKAQTAISELMREQSKRKVIDNRQSQVEGLSQTQKERILRLKEKYSTEIEIEKRSARIIISGLTEDVHDTVFDINEILSERVEEEHQRRYAELVAKTVQWFYIDDNEEPYDDVTNAKLEEAFSRKDSSMRISLMDENNKKQDFEINFKTMKEINLDTKASLSIVRKELGKGIPLPSHWELQPTDTNGKEKDVHLVQLDRSKQTDEYNKVEKAITKTTPINITKIERVQNPELFRAYMVKKQKMDDRNGSNEMKLFHGTATDACSLINQKGFNRSYSGKNAVVYGKGTYFARDASYSMRTTYSPPDLGGNRCMYLANVLVGEYTVGNQQMIEPPPKDPNKPTITYDTTVDNANNPTVFVTFQDNQAYPEYLITFQ